jgi:hypothetical protein
MYVIKEMAGYECPPGPLFFNEDINNKI